jgi:hypothetical protein
MRQPLIAFCLTALATPAFSDTDYSAEIARSGLAATESRLAALPVPTDADRFALGGVRFLGAIEQVLQTRWQTGMTDDLRLLPIFRLPIDENPSPPPFDPTVISTAFRDLSAAMDTARAPLSAIPETSDFGVTIRLADLWFDVNANRSRDAGEDVLDIAGPVLFGWEWEQRDPAAATPSIRFDSADAAWLSAYTHLLGGISDVVLAYDPTDAITRVTDTRAALAALRVNRPADFDLNASFGDFADAVLALTRALDQQPDAARLASAHTHFLDMIAENRLFWSRVATETDDRAEWLPNASQTSALGLALPPDTGAMWLAVLTEAEAALKGDTLIPYWRLDDQAGVNLAKMFTDPAPIDLIGWIEGADALPYLQKGPLMTGESWSRFGAMMGGQAMMLTFYLN